MAGRVEWERYEGEWKGQTIKFNRVWAGHRFTDAECESLCNGDTIIVRDVMGRDGVVGDVRGRLAEMTNRMSGQNYIGFKRCWDVQDMWCDHKFTPEEKDVLRNGGRVHITDAVSKRNGYRFECDVYWIEDKGIRSV